MIGYKRTTLATVSGLLLAALTFIAGCDVFEVDNPGTIQDDDLNIPEAMDALVTGMSADFSAEFDEIGFIGARLSDEMAASGSYFLTTRARRGVIEPEDTDGFWEGMQRARFSAEEGIERMRNVLGENFGEQKRLGARALFMAGLSNRAFGENFCRVVFEGGEAQPREASFQRVLDQGYLDEAIDMAQTVGAEDIETAARGVLAQLHMNLENWDLADQYAEQVPIDFVYHATYSNNSTREYNEIYDETHQRYEMSAKETYVDETNDPRVPYTNCEEESGQCTASNGADGVTIHYRQEKYTGFGGDIPVVKGTEMRLIEAEAALENGDVDTAMEKINEVREFWDLDPVSANEAGDVDQEGTAWAHLDRERGLTLWLEGRRLNDLKRWNHPFITEGRGVVYENNVVQPRASCLPLAESECNNNPNVECDEDEAFNP